MTVNEGTNALGPLEKAGLYGQDVPFRESVEQKVEQQIVRIQDDEANLFVLRDEVMSIVIAAYDRGYSKGYVNGRGDGQSYEQ